MKKSINNPSNLTMPKTLPELREIDNDVFALLTSNVVLTVQQYNYLEEYLFILSETMTQTQTK